MFLHRLAPPICIIAHNGYNFDYPLLNAELNRVTTAFFGFTDCNGNPIYCTDSLLLFKQFITKLRPSGVNFAVKNGDADGSESLTCSTPEEGGLPLSLSSVYKRVFGSFHTGAHTAEGDCIAVLKLVRHIGHPALDWIDRHYRDLSGIRKMYLMSECDISPLPLGLFPFNVNTNPD